VDRDVEDVIIFVGNAQVFALHAVDGGRVQTNELPDAVVDMHDPVARLEVGVDRFRGFGAEHRAPTGLRTAPTENLAVREQVLLIRSMRQHPTSRNRPFQKMMLSFFCA